MTADKRHSVTCIATAAVAKARLVNHQGTHAGPSDAVQGISEVAAAAGRAVPLTTHYSQMVEAGGPVALYDAVGAHSDGSGRAVANPTTVSGRALSAASAAGQLFEMKFEVVGGGGGSVDVAAAVAAITASAVPALNTAVDDGPLIAALVAAGARQLPAKHYYVSSVQTINGITGGKLEVEPGGSITFATGGQLQFTNCRNLRVVNTPMFGALSNAQQYGAWVTGLAAAFASATFDNGAGVDKSGDAAFTHSLSGNTLTLSATNAAGQVMYRALSGFITLGVADRFIVTATGEYGSGSGGASPVFLLYDAANALLAAQVGVSGPWAPTGNLQAVGQHEPANSDTWYSLIAGAAKMKVGFSVGYQAYDERGKVSVIDLMKFKVRRLVNDAAAIDLAGGAPGNFSHLFFSNCVGCEVTNNELAMCNGAWVLFVGSQSCRFEDNRSRTSYECVCAVNCSDTLIRGNLIDNRFQDETGALVNCGHLRRHCISANQSARTLATKNRLVGASWPIEMTQGTGDCTAEDNDIDAEFCAISLDGGVNNSASHNRIRMGYLGGVGIELVNNSGHAVAAGNKIECQLNADAIGITCAKTPTADIFDNQITAALPIFDPCPAGYGRVAIHNNHLRFSQNAFYGTRGDVAFTNNKLRRAGAYCGFSGGALPGALPTAVLLAPAAVFTGITEISGNTGDAGSGGCIQISNVANPVVLNNAFAVSGVHAYAVLTTYPAGAAFTGQYKGNSINGWPGTAHVSGAGQSYVAMTWLGIAAAGSSNACEQNWLNGGSAVLNLVSGANVQLQAMKGYAYFQGDMNVPALAPGEQFTSTARSVPDARLMDRVYPTFNAALTFNGGANALVATAFVEAAGVVRFVVTNPCSTANNVTQATGAAIATGVASPAINCYGYIVLDKL